ncbi:MAG: hypothetical protein IT378_14910 [Sandaracinaceae bacterium]|nr:hypothetical protein [Sandaracinaceae bacterium]
MKRRTFFGAAAAGASVVAMPGIIGPAFAQDEQSGQVDRTDLAHDLALLSDAYRAAQRAGRPLLVLVVPDDGGARYERGQQLGELMNYGGEAAMADLALAEVVCTSMATLRQLVPQAGDGEPTMVLVETESVPATARRIEVTLPALPSHWGSNVSFDELERLSDQAIDQRITLLRDAIHGALASDAAMIERRANHARQRLDDATARRLDAAIASGRVSADLAALAPALLAQAALQSRHAAALRRALAGVAEQRLVRSPVPGSRWARSGGCGIAIEGVENNVLVGCGMGHVPDRSRRFLYWGSRAY